MKVALVVPAIGNDAQVTTPVVNTFVRALARRVELHVFPLGYPTGSETVSYEGALLHPHDGGTTRFRQRATRLVRMIRIEQRRGRFDVVHALWLFEPGALAVLAARLIDLPSVVSIGGAEVVHIADIQYGGLQTFRGRFINRQVLKRASVVTGGSRYVLERAGGVLGRSDGNLLAPLPVDTRRFSPGNRPLLVDPDAPHILHAASLIPVKDQVTLLRAFRAILRSYPNARLTVAGEDPFSYRQGLEELAASLGLGGSVSFAGPVPHAEMPSLYRHADLFMLSSRHESQGMVALEAAATGVPTAGTAVGVVSDLAPDAAVAVPVQSPECLADAALGLLADPRRLRRLGAAARERVVREFGADVVVERFLSIYQAAIEGRAS